MKLFTLFFACSLGLAHASESYAQKAIVNVEVQNKTVGEILKEIEKQSEFDFFFDNTLIDLNVVYQSLPVTVISLRCWRRYLKVQM